MKNTAWHFNNTNALLESHRVHQDQFLKTYYNSFVQCQIAIVLSVEISKAYFALITTENILTCWASKPMANMHIQQIII